MKASSFSENIDFTMAMYGFSEGSDAAKNTIEPLETVIYVMGMWCAARARGAC